MTLCCVAAGECGVGDVFAGPRSGSQHHHFLHQSGQDFAQHRQEPAGGKQNNSNSSPVWLFKLKPKHTCNKECFVWHFTHAQKHAQKRCMDKPDPV